MGWPKGQKRTKPQPEEKQPAPGMKFVPNLVNEEGPIEIPINPPPQPSESRIATFDTCLYHKDEAPRMFRKGEMVPDGWEDSPKKIPDFPWFINSTTDTWEKKT